MIQIFSPLVAIFLFIGCSHLHNEKQLEMLTKDSRVLLKSNLEFLASDELEGREATKNGARVAAQYIASQLKQYGIKPFGDDGTYFQNFKLNRTLIKKDSKLQLVDSQNDREIFNIGESFAVYSAGDSSMAHAGTDIIFVGFGITDSTYDYDDYAGLDVTGKTVVFISGEPEIEGDSLFFEGAQPTKWSVSKPKRALALEKGAAGAILILNMKWLKRWDRLNKYMGSEKFSLTEKKEGNIPSILLDSLLAKKMFGYDKKYTQLLIDLKEGLFKAGDILPFTIKWDINFISDMADARNVVGIIEGMDQSLEKELVTVGAHYDHLGVKGRQVYNGADDNGSGTVAILESARQIAALKSNRRPIVFIFHTAEEKGLLGAYYLTNNFARFDDIIVNINMDMVGREHIDSIFVVGSGKLSSEFFNIVETANKETANFVFDYTLDDENHPLRIYYRSDHWAYAKKGVPVVFLTDQHKEDYHKPTDDVEKINFEKINKVARLTTQIALKVANLDHKLIIDNANISGKTINKENKQTSPSH